MSRFFDIHGSARRACFIFMTKLFLTLCVFLLQVRWCVEWSCRWVGRIRRMDVALAAPAFSLTGRNFFPLVYWQEPGTPPRKRCRCDGLTFVTNVKHSDLGIDRRVSIIACRREKSAIFVFLLIPPLSSSLARHPAEIIINEIMRGC